MGNTKVSAPARYIYVVVACIAPHKRPNVKRPYQFLNAFPTHVSIDASLLHAIPKNAKLEIVTFAGRLSPISQSRIPENLNLAVITRTRKDQHCTTIIRGWADDRNTAEILMRDCVDAEADGEGAGLQENLSRYNWVWEYDYDGYRKGGHDMDKKALRYDVVRVEVGEGITVRWSKTLRDAIKALEEEDRMENDGDAAGTRVGTTRRGAFRHSPTYAALHRPNEDSFR